MFPIPKARSCDREKRPREGCSLGRPMNWIRACPAARLVDRLGRA